MLLHQHWEQSLSAVCRCVSKIKTTLQNIANIANKTLTTKKCKIDVSPGWWFQPTPLKNDGVRQLG